MEAMHPDVDHILFTEEEITAMVKRVGAQISEDYKDLIKNLSSRQPASIEVATFLWKDIEGKQAAINPKYVCTHCPDDFVVGYGLDYAQRYRNLPYVGVLKPEVYS